MNNYFNRHVYLGVCSALIVLLICACGRQEPFAGALPYLNPNVPLEERLDDLVSRMTLDEKISQMRDVAPAVERLQIPKYEWLGECLYGVAFAGIATVFPQSIALASTWDTELMSRVATAISDEARAKHHDFLRKGRRDRHQGLTYWSPNVNLFRNPRWGRGEETYGEDPYLSSRMDVEFVKGLQGDELKYLKLVATPKHYVVHSGPDPERHSFNAVTDERDLRESYLPAFRACIVEGKAYSIMGAQNRYLGEPCSASQLLLKKILRDEWGLDGYVVSDLGAVDDIYEDEGHNMVDTRMEAATMAVKAGCNMFGMTRAIKQAVEQGLITEEEVDVTVKRLFRARFKLGMFDPPERVPYAQIPYEVVRYRKLVFGLAFI